MFLFFFSKKGIKFLKLIPRQSSQKATGQWFKDCLQEMIQQHRDGQNQIRDKNEGKGQYFYIHYDNAPSHRSNLVKNFMEEMKNDKIIYWDQPPYSPD